MGQAASLEEWFDPARVNDRYVAKGFHFGPVPIKDQEEFGLKLPPDDRAALIAFLNTLISPSPREAWFSLPPCSSALLCALHSAVIQIPASLPRRHAIAATANAKNQLSCDSSHN